MEAYIARPRAARRRGKPIDRIASVASFFVSRVDSAVDKQLDEQINETGADQQAQLEALRGKAAIANAKLAYAAFREQFGAERFAALAGKGARVQRPLWASTSHQEPGLSRRLLRRGADRPGHRRHDAARDASRPTSDHGQPESRARRRLDEAARGSLATARRRGHRHGRGHAEARGGRRRVVRQVVRDADRRRGGVARGALHPARSHDGEARRRPSRAVEAALAEDGRRRSLRERLWQQGPDALEARRRRAPGRDQDPHWAGSTSPN